MQDQNRPGSNLGGIPDDEEPLSLESMDDDEPISLELEKPEPKAEKDEEPIQLVDDGEVGEHKPVRQFGSAGLKTAAKELQRPLNITGTGATRCRVFHARVALAALEHLEESVNEWIDGEKIEVKHVGHMIGVMEGKTPRPNLIMVVWY